MINPNLLASYMAGEAGFESGVYSRQLNFVYDFVAGWR